MRNTLLVFCLLMLSLAMQAQDTAAKSGFGEMMRSNNRIYVVVAVIVTILVGLFLYLIRLDRKIGRLEDN